MQNLFKNFLKFLRNLAVGDYRSKKLSSLIFSIISKYNKKRTIKILDFGSGHQPRLIHFLREKLASKYKKKIVIDCYDFYSNKEILYLNKHYKNKFRFYSIDSLKKNKNRYDFALVNDVIHHIGIEKEKFIVNTINNLNNKSTFVFIKDHYQNGKISNLIIRFMDFLGNYFNDVTIPKIYYSKKTFATLIKKTNSKIVYNIDSIKLYPNHLLFMSNPNFNFACLLRKKSKLRFFK